MRSRFIDDLNDRGAIALQQFLLDFVPHLLLISISVSGLMLTASSLWFEGYMYSFITLSHQALVIMTLFYLPFGKLFHIVQRPASIGVELYQKNTPDLQQASCPRCKTEFCGQMWVDDLKGSFEELGFDYSMRTERYCRIIVRDANASCADSRIRDWLINWTVFFKVRGTVEVTGEKKVSRTRCKRGLPN